MILLGARFTKRDRSWSRRNLLHLGEELINALGIFFRTVESEMEIRSTPQLQPLGDFVTNESCGMVESVDGAFFFFFRTSYGDKYLCVTHIWSDTHFADDNGTLETRVFEFAGEHGVDFVRYFFADSFVTMIGIGHRIRATPQNG